MGAASLIELFRRKVNYNTNSMAHSRIVGPLFKNDAKNSYIYRC